jgi:hypothetical protein
MAYGKLYLTYRYINLGIAKIGIFTVFLIHAVIRSIERAWRWTTCSVLWGRTDIVSARTFLLPVLSWPTRIGKG